MKRILFLAIIIVSSLPFFAQSPQAFKYQAVARNANGDVISGQAVAIKCSVVQSNINGTVVYSESHSVSTNQFGLFTLEVGWGTVISGVFTNIDWGSDTHYLKIEMDETGGANYQLMGTSQLLSVPYALHSGTTSDASKWLKSGNIVYYNQGDVGIGTSSPGAKLDIDGDIHFTGRTITSPALSPGFEFNATGIPSPGGNYIAKFQRNGTDQFGIDRNGLLSFLGPEAAIDIINHDFQIRKITGYPLFTFTNSGRLGVGTTIPNTKIEVVDTTTSGFADIGLSSMDSHGALAAYPSTLAAPFEHFAHRVSLFSHLLSGSGLDLRADGQGSDIRFYTGGPWTFNERMWIDSLGRVSIGTSSYTNNKKFRVVGDEYYVMHAEYSGITSTDAKAVYGYSVPTDYYGVGGYFKGGYRGIECIVSPTGNHDYEGVYSYVSGGTGVNYGIRSSAYGSGTNYAGYFSGNLHYTGTLSGPSDKNLKENIQPMEQSLSKIMQLKVSTFNFVELEREKQLNLPEGKQIGLIAQELEQIYPELVTKEVHAYDLNEGKEGVKKDVRKLEYKGINYIGLVPVLTKSIQEQQVMILEQQETINELKKQNNELQARLEKIEVLLMNQNK